MKLNRRPLTALEIATEWLAYHDRFSVVAEVVNGAITEDDCLAMAYEVVRLDRTINAIAQHLACYPGRAAIIEAIDEITAARNARTDKCAQLRSALDDANAREEIHEARIERVREMFCDGTNCQDIAGERVHSTDCMVAIRKAIR